VGVAKPSRSTTSEGCVHSAAGVGRVTHVYSPVGAWVCTGDLRTKLLLPHWTFGCPHVELRNPSSGARAAQYKLIVVRAPNSPSGFFVFQVCHPPTHPRCAQEEPTRRALLTTEGLSAGPAHTRKQTTHCFPRPGTAVRQLHPLSLPLFLSLCSDLTAHGGGRCVLRRTYQTQGTSPTCCCTRRCSSRPRPV
jgi:hypothetical protein